MSCSYLSLVVNAWLFSLAVKPLRVNCHSSEKQAALHYYIFVAVDTSAIRRSSPPLRLLLLQEPSPHIHLIYKNRVRCNCTLPLESTLHTIS
ncbi:hypothetical protein N431DRAFT_436045 [Stipitochalara longipes BDJ]|nr:hypothetical protein N431DRAFT_436045 [Stipitochalara longipes BDJ]